MSGSYDVNPVPPQPNVFSRMYKRLGNIFTSRDRPLSDTSSEDPKTADKNYWYFCFRVSKNTTFKQIITEWLFLATLGVVMALLSFGMDWAIEFIQNAHANLMDIVDKKDGNQVSDVIFQYLLWVTYAIILVTGSFLFSHFIGPQAIGSGIPEIKTILRGVILKEYLTFRTLLSKIVGLTLSLGSGLPIGKEGPFVHIASIVANLMGAIVTSIDNGYANESRTTEMLAAAAAVGVACTFSAPIGGVLFSIEVTSVCFAVRNYWRGFVAATFSATVFRLLRLFNKEAITVVAFYQTNFSRESFLPSELPIFALLGLICGLLSAAFIYLQRRMVFFLRKTKLGKNIFQRYWMIYPGGIALIVSSVTFPEGFGRYIGGNQQFSKAAINFFDNCTFIVNDNLSNRYCSDEIHSNWTDNGNVSVFITLSAFCFVFFFLVILSSTVPIASGVFGPTFIMGSGIGRLVGEFVALCWTHRSRDVTPGVYAVVGAAALAGGVTRTISVAVIVFEITGQLFYILPVMIAVLIANAVASYFQPSIYDSIIKMKNLPYLPDIPQTSSNFHGILVEQFMTSDVRYLAKTTTYGELKDLLLNMRKIKAFPIVENSESRILIGSCSRLKLLQALNKHIGAEARQAEHNRRVKEAISDLDRRFKMMDRERASIYGSRQPSIFESFEELIPPPGTETATTSTENIGNLSNGGARFTIVPVKDPQQQQAIPGHRPGGRRGGVSVENHLISMIDADEVPQPLRHQESLNERKISQNSIISFLSNDIKREKQKNFTNDEDKDAPNQSAGANGTNDKYQRIGDALRNFTKLSFGKFKSPGNGQVEDYDMTEEDQFEWEQAQLAKPIDFENIGLDPAPFQLVENSSLFKVHSLFSLLSLNRAYVTKCGQLVGVVALKDLRIAVEKAQAGLLVPTTSAIYNKAPSNLLIALGKAHIVMPEDDDYDDDADNDRLFRCLEVVSPDASKVKDEIAQLQDEESPVLPK